MKKCLFICLSLFFSVGLFAQEPDGLTCENAIPVDTSFTGSIPAPGIYYYSAWTYDLPLACYFYPEDKNVSELYLDVDFTCTPGVYDDPKIEDLLNATIGWGVEMPIRFDDFEQGTDEYGRTYYTLAIQETYRELMANFGVSYNVQALIKVTTSSAGDIHMAPDTTFKACVENSIWLNLPDTARAGVMYSDESYVLPMSDWQNDSIQFRWTGKQAPVQVWIGDKCGFDLSLTGSNCAVDYFQLQPDAGNGENIYEMSRQMILDMIDLLEKGGIYYVRIISVEDAELIVEKQAVDGPLANAIELELDVPAKVSAQDKEQVYYFPKEWKSRNLEFVSSVATPITAYVSKSIDFEANVSDPNVVGVYDFVVSSADALWQMSLKEMDNLSRDIPGEFIFVKFVSAQSTYITPLRWKVCECVQKSAEIYSTDSVRVNAKTSSVSYRINYSDWSKRDVKLYWSSVADMKAYLVDTCAGFSLRPTNNHVLFYHEYLVDNQGVTDTLTITADQMKTFADRVDEDGYLYFRFNANSYGDLLVSSVLVDTPVIPDPVFTSFDAAVCFGETYEWNGQTYSTAGEYTITLQDANGCNYQATLILTVLPEEKPEEDGTILLNPTDELVLNLDSAVNVYRTDYDVWSAGKVQLSWYGDKPLHVFVSKDKDFFVAIYHEDVVLYQKIDAVDSSSVEPQVLVLDMSALRAYVNDGKLYVRFLTDSDARLVIEPLTE